MYKCPVCGWQHFVVNIETPIWEVDGHGNILKQFVYEPCDTDLWTCAFCGANGLGKDFYIADEE